MNFSVRVKYLQLVSLLAAAWDIELTAVELLLLADELTETPLFFITLSMTLEICFFNLVVSFNLSRTGGIVGMLSFTDLES